MNETSLGMEKMRAGRGRRPAGPCRAARRWAARALLAALLVGVGVGAAPADGGRPVDLNTATAAELAALPGIGPAKADAIVAHRQATPFRSVEELRDVKGIGEKLFEQLRPRLTVSGSAAATSGAHEGAGSATKPSRQGARATQSRPGT